MWKCGKVEKWRYACESCFTHIILTWKSWNLEIWKSGNLEIISIFILLKNHILRETNHSVGVLLKIGGAVRHKRGSGLKDLKPYNQKSIEATPSKYLKSPRIESSILMLMLMLIVLQSWSITNFKNTPIYSEILLLKDSTEYTLRARWQISVQSNSLIEENRCNSMLLYKSASVSMMGIV